jgi:hypothetical protein
MCFITFCLKKKSQTLASGLVADTKTKPDRHMSPHKALYCFSRNAQEVEVLQDCAQRNKEAKFVSIIKNI